MVVLLQPTQKGFPPPTACAAISLECLGHALLPQWYVAASCLQPVNQPHKSTAMVLVAYCCQSAVDAWPGWNEPSMPCGAGAWMGLGRTWVFSVS